MTTTEIQMKSLMVRCKEFFGFKPGQTLPEFKREVDQLTKQDRADLAKMFNNIGMPTTDG